LSIPHFIEYLNFEKNYSPYTITAYKNDLESFQIFCKNEFDERDISKLPYTIIRSWIVSLVDDGIANRSINRKVSSLKSYFKYLVKTKQISQNPLLKHRSLKISKKVNIPFSQAEVADVLELFKGADTFEEVRDKLIIELMYTTGMRRSELIGVKIGDIDLTQNTVKVIGKRNKERQIPLLNSVVTTIKNYLIIRNEIKTSVDYFLITKKGKKMYPTLVYRLINEYFSKVSLKIKKSPHVIRHSFATHLLNEGADLNSVKELLGHASLVSTQVYTHNNLKGLKKMYNHAHPRGNKNY